MAQHRRDLIQIRREPRLPTLKARGPFHCSCHTPHMECLAGIDTVRLAGQPQTTLGMNGAKWRHRFLSGTTDRAGRTGSAVRVIAFAEFPDRAWIGAVEASVGSLNPAKLLG